MSKTVDYFGSLSKTFVDNLERNQMPWQQPWELSFKDIRPVNGLTNKPYQGANNFWLMMQSSTSQYNENRWCTFNQAKQLGISVKAKEKGFPVFYFSKDRVIARRDDQGKIKKDTEGKTLYDTKELNRPVLKYHTLFNFDQTDQRIPHPNKTLRTSNDMPVIDLDAAKLQLEYASKQLNVGIKEGLSSNGQAYYDGKNIMLPPAGSFNNPGKFYATAFHEMCHALVDRAGLSTNSPFGSKEYAKEEIRVEMASYLLGVDLGVGHDPSNHQAYVRSWTAEIKQNPFMINHAAKDAQLIANSMQTIFEQYDASQAVNLEEVFEKMNKNYSPDGKSISKSPAVTVEANITPPSILDASVGNLRSDINAYETNLREASPQPNSNKMFLVVDYDKRFDFTKKLNALNINTTKYGFDKKNTKLWWVDSNVFEKHKDDLSVFEPKSSEVSNISRAGESKEAFFERILNEKGIIAKSLDMHDKWVRTSTTDKPGSQNGTYRIRPPRSENEAWVISVNNYAAGTGLQSFAHMDNAVAIDPRQKLVKKALDANLLSVTHAKQTYEQDIEAKLNSFVKEKITDYYKLMSEQNSNGEDLQKNHPYIMSKGLEDHAPDPSIVIDKDGLIVVPGYKNNQLSTLQYINDDGDKYFIKHSEKKGAFFELDATNDEPKMDIIVCEGYATGRTLNSCTGKAVAVAFDSGNIDSVVTALNAKYPDARIIIAGDNDFDYAEHKNDSQSKKNALNIIGEYQSIADRLQAVTILPSFSKNDFSDAKVTDWNDLEKKHGAKTVKEQFSNGLKGIQTAKNSHFSYSFGAGAAAKKNDKQIQQNQKVIAKSKSLKKTADIGY